MLRDLKQMLETSGNLSGLTDVYIVVDALDECPQNVANYNREQLMDLLVAVNSLRSTKFHFLATSRPETDIESKLSSIVGICEIRIKAGEVDEDIARHISDRLERDEKLNSWKSADKDEIKQVLSKKPKGMYDSGSSAILRAYASRFRWVQCHLDQLKLCKKRKDLKEKLHDLPKDLDQTYERIMDSIDDDYKDLAIMALTWLCHSVRPLTLDEIAEAAVIDTTKEFDTEERLVVSTALLEIMGSLVTMISVSTTKQFPEMFKEGETQTSCMQLAHFTVKEYLFSTRLLDTNLHRFHLTSDSAEISLALGCVQYIRTLGTLRRSLDQEANSSYPLFIYSCRYFSWHLRRVPENRLSDINTAVVEFVQSRDATSILWPDTSVNGRLIFAARYGLVAGVRALLDEGADVNKQCIIEEAGEEPVTALVLAVQHVHANIVAILLENGANSNATLGTMPVLHIALGDVANPDAPGETRQSVESSLDIMRLLLKHRADPNSLGYEGETTLGNVLHQRNYKAVELLLDHGTDPNSANEEGDPVLWDAIIDPNLQMMIELLLSRGADPNLINQEGEHMLDAALTAKRYDVVKLLLRYKANARAITKADALQNLISDPNGDSIEELLRLLIEHGAEVNSFDDISGTPLHVAIDKRNLTIVRLLLDHGADTKLPVTMPSRELWNYVKYARVDGWKEGVSLLLEYGAKEE